jgi:glutamine cyclotransferase
VIRPLRLCLRVAVLLALGAATLPALAEEVAVYGYKVLERRAHPRDNFVQGLEIRGDTLYVGTGGYGSSALREYDFSSMRQRREYLLPQVFFGEGITRLGAQIYQLTWRSGVGLVYDSDTLQPLRHWRLATQGWGLTSNGSELIYSDGSHRLYFANPDRLEEPRTLEVTLNGRPLPRLNELEWIEGAIWANVWGAYQLVVIDPRTGAVTAIVDLRGLLPESERRPDTDVLNGIAWDQEQRALWVTGKRWPWLYRIETIPQTDTTERESR